MRHLVESHLSRRTRSREVVQEVAISSAMLDALMSLPKNTGDERSPVKNDSVSFRDSKYKDEKQSTPGSKKSALIFTPPQLYKVHKKKRESSYLSLVEIDNQKPVVEGLERSRDNGTYLKDHSGKEIEKDRTPDSERSTTQKSHSLSHKVDHELDRSLETYSSRDKYYRLPSTKSRFSDSPRTSGSSALKSISPSQKSCDDSENEFNMSQSSSIYVTPVGTPFSMKSPKSIGEERCNSRIKRSLSEEYDDEGHTANSSFDYSSYDTPQGSPRKLNSAKRPKIRWSDTSSYIQDKSSYSSWRLNLSCNLEQGVQPELIGYQMVGDSQFCRFGQQLLGLERVPMSNCPGRIGICVSGQTITDLHRRVKDDFYPISDKIILMIGTNDFLRNVDVRTMCEELSALIKTLQKIVSNIILLTLPPIPKLEKKSSSHFKLLDVYNTYIRSLENGKTLRIADVSPLYMTSQPHQRCRMHLFEVYFGGPAKRFDMIHLNRLGLEVIRKYILDRFLI